MEQTKTGSDKGKKSGIEQGVKAKSARSKAVRAAKRGLLGRLDPQSWSLKGRFLYLTGALLLLGNLILISYLHVVLDGNIDRSAQDRLALLTRIAIGEVSRTRDSLRAQALALAETPTVRAALDMGDDAALEAFLIPYLNRVRQGLRITSLELRFARIGNVDHDVAPTLAGVLDQRLPLAGVRMVRGVPVVQAAAPVLVGRDPLGAVLAEVSLRDVLSRVDLPPEYGLVLLRPGDAPGEAGRVFTDVLGNVGPSGGLPDLVSLAVGDIARKGDRFVTLTSLIGPEGDPSMDVAVVFDASLLGQSKWNRINLFSWFFLGGALVLWFVLYFNVTRIERFFNRLKKIIISSHSNYFGERFETDHVHCLDVMHCHNEECPVYQNPSLVCYLETGSEAISPRWRDTCIFLNKYDSCRSCPVYALRKGDELTEMRNVVNTMMRLWSNFLGRVGHLLAYVLRSQEQSGQMPSLDEISDRLEEMARLTFFGHDLQGVLDKQEVYAQLEHAFAEHFNLRRMVLFEVHREDDHVETVVDTVPDEPLCRHVVLTSTEGCRACRTGEDVSSFYNPVLCPHFNCDHGRDVRCCMPVLMGGKVGAVASFMAPRRTWETLRKQLPVLRKYLDESAPVLASLQLLRLSKEQALRDPLTRCHNRRFLDEFITKFEPLADRENRTTGLLMCDIDYFKQVNDEFGHEAGDAVLKQVVHIIEASIRKTDLLIRYGGEEFLALLQNVEPGTSRQVAEKIRESVQQADLKLPGGNAIHKTISVGVAEFPQDAQAMYKAIKFADVALYEAKRTGRNKVMRFEEGMWTEEEY